jgi:hypothetical protein
MTNNDMLLAAITKVFEILDRNQDFVVDLTRQLVGYKSINPNFINNPESSQETEV